MKLQIDFFLQIYYSSCSRNPDISIILEYTGKNQFTEVSVKLDFTKRWNKICIKKNHDLDKDNIIIPDITNST